MSCEDVAQLLLNHPLVPKISRKLSLFTKIFVVIEIDLPWDSNSVDTHGINFTAWREEQFKRLTKTLTTNLINPFCFVVLPFTYST